MLWLGIGVLVYMISQLGMTFRSFGDLPPQALALHVGYFDILAWQVVYALAAGALAGGSRGTIHRRRFSAISHRPDRGDGHVEGVQSTSPFPDMTDDMIIAVPSVAAMYLSVRANDALQLWRRRRKAVA